MRASTGLPVYVAKRVVAALVLLLVTSFVVFVMQHLAPGSPEATLLGGRPSTPQLLDSIRRQYHLDDPVLAQYWYWLRGAVSANFGESITYKSSVSAVVGSRIGPTLQLGVLSALVTIAAGLVLGAVAAVKENRLGDSLISGTVLVFASISGYVSGVFLLGIFSVKLGWFPVLGTGEGGLDRLYHLVLPSVALSLSLIALIARTTRAAVVRTLARDFVDNERARGFTERRIFFKHVARNSLIPVLTVSGLAVGYLISGAVLVEYTFGLNGLGSLLVEAVQSKDYAVVQAIALLFTATFIALNLLVDLLYGLVDPRVRLGEGAA